MADMATVMVDTATVMADMATVMADTATVMADMATDMVATVMAISGTAIGGAMVKAHAGAGPRQVMCGFAIRRTSEYLTASGSAARHEVVRRSFLLLEMSTAAPSKRSARIGGCRVRFGERIARDLH